ncbi:hypothetical protein [Epibacterium ulvae]|uniref:hypothetical protein n=1 Tax=Epibacterium ulvae TaxID=1156985 RepID=UPI0024923C39|nr:hypothetical protein [Epibacterium ulvae]
MTGICHAKTNGSQHHLMITIDLGGSLQQFEGKDWILMRDASELSNYVDMFHEDVTIKPQISDNSFGVVRCASITVDLSEAYTEAVAYHDDVIGEEFIPLGNELRTAVLERREQGAVYLPTLEYKVDNDTGFRSATDKVQVDVGGETVRNFNLGFSPEPLTHVEAVSRRMHKADGRPGDTILDTRVDPSGQPFVIEAAAYFSFKGSGRHSQRAAGSLL